VKITKHHIFRIVQVVILAAIGYFLARNLVGLDWAAFSQSLVQANRWFLALSMIMTVGGGLLVALGWGFILRALGQKILHGEILRIYYLSELAKYVPGKIWTAVGRVMMLEKKGVPRLITIASVGVMLIILAVSGVLVSLATLPLWPSLEVAGDSRLVILLVALVPIGLAALHPRIFQPVLNWFLRKVEHVEAKVNLRYSSILLLVLYWCGLWVIKGTATYFLLTILPDEIFAAHPLPAYGWLLFSGIMAVSWILGTISPFTPAGLGIAELSIVVLLESLFSIPVGYGTIFAVFIRIWSVVAELICVGITFRLDAGSKKE
jgi:uncharacterized membrane protein YbhN (UPF0104 family)